MNRAREEIDKREEIKNGLYNILRMSCDNPVLYEICAPVVVGTILDYLHSQGVVIKTDKELLWRYETCDCCTRQQRIAWSVSNELWSVVVADYYKTRILCLECFLRMAHDREIRVNIADINLHASIQRDKAGYVAVEPLIKEVLDDR